MKFLIATLLTALLSFILAGFCPWWIISIVAFIVAAAIPQKPLLSFLSAAIAVFFLWGLQTYIIDQKNDHILAARISDLLIHRQAPLLMIFASACLGAGVSGFSALSGSLLRKIFVNRP
ncbi:hypothetical protein WG906_15930 [Pedobacter sp. P351]|uniref:hypothetical protein n=1 Tax=Pedobacter superstes TaxID=3133441 RepID=UPI0030B4E49C